MGGGSLYCVCGGAGFGEDSPIVCVRGRGMVWRAKDHAASTLLGNLWLSPDEKDFKMDIDYI